MRVNIAKIPKGAVSLDMDIEEKIYKGKTIFVVRSITYYGSPSTVLEIKLGDPCVESKCYPGITK